MPVPWAAEAVCFRPVHPSVHSSIWLIDWEEAQDVTPDESVIDWLIDKAHDLTPGESVIGWLINWLRAGERSWACCWLLVDCTLMYLLDCICVVYSGGWSVSVADQGAHHGRRSTSTDLWLPRSHQRHGNGPVYAHFLPHTGRLWSISNINWRLYW